MDTSTLTISRRINAGFLVLVVFSAILGLFAVYHMRSAATGASFLAEAVAPQAGVSAELSDASANAQLAVRTYGLTGDIAELELAKKHLGNVSTALDNARKLSVSHPELTALRDGVKAAEEDLKNYLAGFEATRTLVVELAQIRQQLDTSAASFVKEISSYIDEEDQMLAKEISAGLSKDKLEIRRSKSEIANHIIDAGNAIRVATFKAQALRDPQLIEKVLPQFDEMEKRRQQLLKITSEEADLKQLEVVKKSADTYHAGVDAIIKNYRHSQQVGAQRAKAGDEFDSVVNGVLKRSIERTLEYSRTTAEGLASSSTKVMIGLVLVIAASIGCALLIVRSINKVLSTTSQSLTQGSLQVASASGQVSSASQSLAEGSSEQAASLEEISSSLEELSSTTKHNASNAGSAKVSADEARTAAERGSSEMQRMQQAMEAIRQSSADISKILKTIDEIAFQTNILALNAAVEAARAGEAGAGFAVVADEVRSLAQRCAVAAKETAEKISEATTRSEQGVELSNQVAACLTQILEKARHVDTLVAEVSTASTEQSSGIDQINTAISQLDKVTQSNAATAEETASASEELNAQSEELRFAAVQLAALVGLSTEHATAPAEKRVEKAHPASAEHAPSTAHALPPAKGNNRRPMLKLNGSSKPKPELAFS